MQKLQESKGIDIKEQVIKDILSNAVGLLEVLEAARERIDNTLIKDIPSKAFDAIKRIKATDSNGDNQERINEIQEYIVNILLLEENTTLNNNINGKKYLNLGEDNIYEIIEQRGNIIIGYNPITEENIVYKFIGEDSDENKVLKDSIIDLKKTHIEGYYNMPFYTDEVENGAKAFNSYYYIGKNGELQHIKDVKTFGVEPDKGLKKYGNTIIINDEGYITIHNGSKLKLLEIEGHSILKNKVGGYFMKINEQNGTFSLFDLDSMKFVFQNAETIECEDDKITYTLPESRNIIMKNLFGQKSEKRIMSLLNPYLK